MFGGNDKAMVFRKNFEYRHAYSVSVRRVIHWNGNNDRVKGIFVLSNTSRPAVGLTKPTQWVPEGERLILWGVKRPGSEADNSPPSGGQIKNKWSCNALLIQGIHKRMVRFQN